MQYETLLFTRIEQQDYAALVRPEGMSEADITALSKLFNAAYHAGRLREECPGLYFFPVGDYAVLVRHYTHGNSLRGVVVEGAAFRLGAGGMNGSTAAKFVVEQARLLNVSGTIRDEESPIVYASDTLTLDDAPEGDEPSLLATALLERRTEDQLFLPFTAAGHAMLAGVLADHRFETPPYFAFGTNSEMLAQLEQLTSIDIASFTKTERPSLRDRVTNQVTRYLDEGSGEPDYEAARTQRMQIYRKPQNKADDPDRYEDTRVGAEAMPIQNSRREDNGADSADEYDPDDTVLAMQQIPTGTRNNAAQEESPLRRVTRKLTSLLSPRKTE